MRGSYAANVLVESKVGAGGRIAVEFVKRAKPDGLTILQIPASIMTLYPHIYKNLAYNPLTDFAPGDDNCHIPLLVHREFRASGGRAHCGRFRRLGARQSNHLVLWNSRGRLFVALRRNDAAALGRHRVHRSALSRRRAAAYRHACRRDPGQLQRARRSVAAHPQRQAALAGGMQSGTVQVPARRSDHGRAGHQGDCFDRVARLVPSRQDAGRYRAPTEPGRARRIADSRK